MKMFKVPLESRQKLLALIAPHRSDYVVLMPSPRNFAPERSRELVEQSAEGPEP
jgi:hypothetical protein